MYKIWQPERWLPQIINPYDWKKEKGEVSTFRVLEEKKPLGMTLNVSFYGLSAGGVHIH